jgi:hypothetical protein
MCPPPFPEIDGRTPGLLENNLKNSIAFKGTTILISQICSSFRKKVSPTLPDHPEFEFFGELEFI